MIGFKIEHIVMILDLHSNNFLLKPQETNTKIKFENRKLDINNKKKRVVKVVACHGKTQRTT